MKLSDIVKTAFQKAVETHKNSYSPYSNFAVASSIIDNKGRIYTGCNVENSSFGATMCAERTAIFKAASEGSREFSDVVVISTSDELATPCGMCLQVMAEFCKPNTKVWIGNLKEIKQGFEFKDINPHPFGPRVFSK